MKTKPHFPPFPTRQVSKTFFHSTLMTTVILLLALSGAKLLPSSLVDELNRMGVSIQRPAVMDIHEARLMNSQTKVKVVGQGLKAREILSNYIPLEGRGRILWIARTRLASGEISSVQFRR
jgi:hypothetical protein